MNQKHHTEVLGTMGIGRLVARIAVPSSVALFVTSTYNLVDAIFVGRGVGPEAIGALTLVFPFQMFVMAFSDLFATGAASVASRALGARDQPRAEKVAGAAIGAALLLGVFITIVGKLCLSPLLTVLAATDSLYEPTREYLSVILYVEPILLANFTANALIRAEGQARIAMMTLATGMLVNIGLDPLFIYGFGWGVGGAALATVIGRSTSLVLIIVFYARGKSSLRIRLQDLVPRFRLLKEVMAIGLSGFVRHVSTSLVQTVRNNLLIYYGGGTAVAALGAVFRAIVFLGMPAMGIAQALPPIVGYNYGAGDVRRVRRALWVSMVACTVFMGAGFAFLQAAPRLLLRLFSTDAELLDLGVVIMRLNAFLLLFFSIYFLGPSYFQAMGRAGNALFLSLLRPVLGLIVALAGARLVGTIGIVAADPVAVAIGAVISFVFLKVSVDRLVLAKRNRTGTPQDRWCFPADNPVITPGFLNAPYDAARAGAPHVVSIDGTYRMVYWGSDTEGRNYVLQAESGVEQPNRFTARSRPLIGPQPERDYNHYGPGFPFLLPTDGAWLLYFTAWGKRTNHKIPNTTGVALSYDQGTTWQYHDEHPIIPLDRPYDREGTGSVWVLYESGTYRMYYTAIGEYSRKPDNVETGHGELIPRIGIAYAESKDGIHWEKPVPNLVVSPRGFEVSPYEYICSKPCVLRDSSGYTMWVNTFGTAYRVHRLNSTDGVRWEWSRRVGPDGEMGIGNTGSFDDHQRSYPAVVCHNGERRCWYTGNGFGVTGIGYAISADP